jgi:hypothetical protein
MAQSAGDPNSADSQFFFNLANNSSALDPQDFTVFGRMLDNTDFDTLKTSPVIDLSAGNTTTAFEAAHPSALMSSVPMANYTGNVNTFPGDAVAANFMVINSITVDRRDEFLTYSVVSNSNPGVVTASIDTDAKEQLRLDYTQDGHGAATIVVRATDRFGAFVDMSFRVIVGNNAPTANVTLTPSAAAASDATLTADVVANDADSDPVTLTYRWFLGGTLVKTTSNTTSTSDTLNLTTLTGVDPGDLIEVQVTPNDGFVNGTNAIDTLNVNRAPTFDATPVFTPSNPTATEPVTVSSPATDSDGGDVVKYSYDWAVDGTSVRTVTDTLLSSDTLNLSLVTGVQSGDVINVTIIASDGKNGGSTTTTAQTTVL